MLRGVNLTLMIGPAVPVPVSREVLDALTSVVVVTGSGMDASGFELSFTLSTHSILHTLFLVAQGASVPLVRVVIVVTIGGQADVLIDGVMTEHEISPGTDGGHAVLKIKGKDLSAVLDYIDFSGIPYPAMPAEARVALILAKYMFLGIVPLVIPSVLIDVPIPVDRIHRQQGKDLPYIKMLARRVGYVFYMEPGPVPGTSFAYWGPEVRVGQPQPALNQDMDAHTNVETLSFKYDNEKKEMPIVFFQEPTSKVPIGIPIPDIGPLSPPLGLIPPIPKKFPPVTYTAKYSPVQAIAIGMAIAARTADAVEGSGTLDVVRYGRPLKSRKLVGVRGAGVAFDGLYYVKSVTSTIKRGEYKQSFTLARNGLVSTFPLVPS